LEIRLSEAELAAWRSAAAPGDVSTFVRMCVEAELERQAAPATSSPTLDELLERVRA
jgi:hypothetical protein